MTTAATLKKKRRKMKQMQGLLLLARPQQSVTTADGKTLFGAFKKVLVVLQPQQLQLAYSAQVRWMGYVVPCSKRMAWMGAYSTRCVVR